MIFVTYSSHILAFLTHFPINIGRMTRPRLNSDAACLVWRTDGCRWTTGNTAGIAGPLSSFRLRWQPRASGTPALCCGLTDLVLDWVQPFLTDRTAADCLSSADWELCRLSFLWSYANGHCIGYEQLERWLRTFLFGCWDRGAFRALWLIDRLIAPLQIYLLTYLLTISVGLIHSLPHHVSQ